MKPRPVRPTLALPDYLAEVPRFHLALAASIALHGVLLTVGFAFPGVQREFKDKALEIVLVNAKTRTRPSEAQVLAQNNLDGGGNIDEKRRARTPLPPSPNSKAGDRLEEAQQRVRELEVRQRELLTQSQKPAPAVGRDRPSEKVPDTAQPTPTGRELASSALAMVHLQAEIDRNVEAYNKRPRRQFVGTRASEYRFAQYVEDWRLKIERVGTLNYPQAARGTVYGSLLLTVIILADGNIDRIEVNRTSGHKVLDDAARRIVQMAAPYPPFPPDIRRDTDILEITRTISFAPGDQVLSK